MGTQLAMLEAEALKLTSGEVRFSHNADGELLEFATTNVDATISNGDRIILKRRPDGADASA